MKSCKTNVEKMMDLQVAFGTASEANKPTVIKQIEDLRKEMTDEEAYLYICTSIARFEKTSIEAVKIGMTRLFQGPDIETIMKNYTNSLKIDALMGDPTENAVFPLPEVQKNNYTNFSAYNICLSLRLSASSR